MREVDLTPIIDYTMPSGLGELAGHSACVVAQAAIIDAIQHGHQITKLTDTLECACPVLRVLAIALNDISWWASDAERTETLRPLIPLLLDSRRSPTVTAVRAEKAAAFAEYAAESAAKSAKYAAEYAAKSAESAAKYAAEYAAKSAAEYAEYAKYAKYAATSAESAAEYAAESAAKYAESAAEYAEYAEYAAKSAESAAKYAAKSAEYAKSAAKLKPLREELLRTWMECEAIQ